MLESLLSKKMKNMPNKTKLGYHPWGKRKKKGKGLKALVSGVRRGCRSALLLRSPPSRPPPGS